MDIAPNGTALYVCTLPSARAGACELAVVELRDADPEKPAPRPAQLRLQADPAGAGKLAAGAHAFASQLKPMQIRSIAVAPAQAPNTPFVIGTIFGEVELVYPNGTQNVIPVHREGASVYAVNCVAVCPTQPWAISAGGDGTLAMLSFQATGKVAKSVRPTSDRPGPGATLTSVCFSAGGEVVAIAAGYDWSRGMKSAFKDETENERVEPRLFIKKVGDADFR
jgi:hypothetical protein